ncbi:MAG TPA: SIS domain-containing protein [Thermoleophilaceae bacterium]|nr:SIS domain-containing protein [Thermoleophilaceae bacterium]
MNRALSTPADPRAAVRVEAGERFFGAEARRLAELCHRMAERFARGGRLLAVGGRAQARSDARHVAVEFVHPVIVGKRALPALALTAEGGPVGEQLALEAEAADMVMFFGHAPGGDGVALSRGRGCLTIAFEGCGAEWELIPPSEDPFVRQELVETAYHVLWELVHVFFEHRGLLDGRDARTVHDTGASSFLYPFLAEAETELDGVLADVRSSVLAKAAETGTLRARTLTEARPVLAAAAAELRARMDRGGRLLALGNGGSATDAMDAVADLREPPGSRPPRRGLDLTEDSSILTAVANDVGVDAVFARQVIAHGRAQDGLLALSTSGNSANVIEALAHARKRGMLTIAMVGYDGGRVAEERLADHVVVVRSEHIPRIQEAQASAWHVLRELLEDPR